VDGTDAPPEIDYDNSQSQQTITVIANENVDKLSGKVYLNISWTPTRQYDGALVLVDGKNVYTAKMSETSYTMEAISLKEYEITIKPIDLFGNPETQSTIKYTVKYDAPPVPPTMITTQPFNGGYICIV
jgi:predicted phage tail protein